jgi:hypothetical protein
MSNSWVSKDNLAWYRVFEKEILIFLSKCGLLIPDIKSCPMKTTFTLLLLVLLLNCKEEPKGKPVAFSEACNGKYWAKEVKGLYEGERIAFPGYLSLSGMELQTDTINLDLHEKPDRLGKKIVVSVRVNGGKNGIDKLGKVFKEGDLKIHVASGETLGSNDKVIIHGEHIGDSLGNPLCLFKAKIIEKGS